MSLLHVFVMKYVCFWLRRYRILFIKQSVNATNVNVVLATTIFMYILWVD